MGNSGTGCFSGGPGVNDGMILGWEFFMTFILVCSNVSQTLSWPWCSIETCCRPSQSCRVLLLLTGQCCHRRYLQYMQWPLASPHSLRFGSLSGCIAVVDEQHNNFEVLLQTGPLAVGLALFAMVRQL